MVQFDILIEVMVGLYWSLGGGGEGEGGGQREEEEMGREGDVIGSFCRASPPHLHWLRDLTSPHSEAPKSICFNRVSLVYSLHKILKK